MGDILKFRVYNYALWNSPNVISKIKIELFQGYLLD